MKLTISDALREFAGAFKTLADALEVDEEESIVFDAYAGTLVDRVFGVARVHFGLAKERLAGQGRTQLVVTVRHAVAYVLRKHCGLSYPAIGQLLNKDHTTIMSAVKSVERWSPEAKRKYLDRMIRVVEAATAKSS